MSYTEMKLMHTVQTYTYESENIFTFKRVENMIKLKKKKG